MDMVHVLIHAVGIRVLGVTGKTCSLSQTRSRCTWPLFFALLVVVCCAVLCFGVADLRAGEVCGLSNGYQVLPFLLLGDV